MTQWIDSSVEVGGKAIFFLSESTLYAHLVFLLILNKGKLSVPRWVFSIFIPLVIYLLGHLVYSFMFADGGNAILTTRRLIYWPFMGLIVGYATAVAARDSDFVRKVLELSLKITFPLLLINVVLRFHMFQEFGFISRATGVILSALVFRSLLQVIEEKSQGRKQLWMGLAAFLLVFITSSRGVYLAFAIVTGLLIWQHRKLVGVVRMTKILAGGLVGFAIIVTIALSSPLVIKTLEKFGSDIENVATGNMGSHGEKFNTLGARYYLYLAAFELGLESPVFGKGSGYKVDEWYLGGTYNIDRKKTPHNYYLDIWYRLGLVGLVLFFLFYRRLFQLLIKKEKNIYYMLLMALAYSTFDVLLSSTASAIVPIFVLVGATLGQPIRNSVPE